MTTPTGRIQMSDINQEIWQVWNRRTGLNEDPIRILGQVNRTSGTTVAMDWLRGKSWWIAPTASGSNVGYSGTFFGSMSPRTEYMWAYLTIYNGSGNFSTSWSVISGGFSIDNASTTQVRIGCYIPRYGTYTTGTVRATITDNSNGYVFTKDFYVEVNVYDGNNPM